MRIPLALVAAAALLLAAPAGAQEQPRPPSRVELAGRVTDANTGAPVAGVAVRIPQQRRAAVTDSAGRFTLARLRPGEHRVVVSRIGYADMIARVAAGAEGPEVVVELIPRPLVLEGIAVLADRLQQRRRSVAVSVRAIRDDEIQRTGASRPMQIVQRYAHLAPCPPRSVEIGWASQCVIARGGLQPVTVVIDEIPSLAGLDELDSYSPQDLHLIEVYAGGAMVRAYTNNFMERLARTGRQLDPVVSWGGHRAFTLFGSPSM